MDLELLLSMAVSLDEERPAVTGTDGRTLTTGELQAAAVNAAAILRRSGAAHAGFCDTNGLTFPVAFFGAVKAKMPFAPLNYRLADAQLGQVVRGQDLVAVAPPAQATRLGQLGVDRLLDSASFLESALNIPADAAGVGEHAPVDPDEVALLLYTSGTTAAPKAAVLRHRHLAAYVIGTVEFGSASQDEAALLSVPPYHIAGVMNLLSNLYMGRRIIYLDAFEPRRWLEVVLSESVTHAMVVPTMLARIVSVLGGTPADVPSLRTISYGGAKMPAAVIRQALELFPDVAFANAYGLTETSSTVCVLGPEDHRLAQASDDPAVRARLGSVGLPVPGIEVEIRDAEGLPCIRGRSGEIFVRGEQVAGEYVGAGSAGDGWFATRDGGHLDEAGYLFVEGRSDDTIIRGGENIAPAEIEDVLLAHDDVADCAVVGIDDEEWGQRIAAAVVLVEGSGSSPDDLRDYARTQLRGSKTPDVVVVFDELPYTDTGKLLRRVVREELTGSSVAPGR
ncbi:MAG TPA: fatty acid--CoA ligase family protein [Acidimicrobiales bacterium]|nr:fatty acid--CoA ligase family protein [Acidimicrobiales bacterium]